MPNLNHLSCQIESTVSRRRYKEYGTVYGDSFVETYVAIPSKSKPFAVHLTSDGYIAPGLAMFVFKDGIPQCKRHRMDLMVPSGRTADKRTLIDFCVYQREDELQHGTVLAQQWTFNPTSNDVVDSATSFQSLEDSYAGSIEVIVLRCIAQGGEDLTVQTTTPAAGTRPAQRPILKGMQYLKRPKENLRVHFSPSLGEVTPSPEQSFGLDGIVEWSEGNKEQDKWIGRQGRLGDHAWANDCYASSKSDQRTTSFTFTASSGTPSKTSPYDFGYMWRGNGWHSPVPNHIHPDDASCTRGSTVGALFTDISSGIEDRNSVFIVKRYLDHFPKHLNTALAKKFRYDPSNQQWLDSFESPYAVFRFKYRNKEVLRRIRDGVGNEQ